MNPRERTMTSSEVKTRASHARAYFMVAELVHDDRSIESGTNLVGALAVLAGIAASDAICGHTIGRRAGGDAHDEAIRLLKGATPPNSRASTHLARLLGSKTDTQYSPMIVSGKKAAELLASARKLIGELETLLRT